MDKYNQDIIKELNNKFPNVIFKIKQDDPYICIYHNYKNSDAVSMEHFFESVFNIAKRFIRRDHLRFLTIQLNILNY